MKNGIRFIFYLLFLSNRDVTAQGMDWSAKNAEKWFGKGEWLDVKPVEAGVKYDQFGRILESDGTDTTTGRAGYLQIRQLAPDPSINKVEFAKQYHAKKHWWQEAFSYLQQTDLQKLPPGRYQIDGDDVYATITEGPGKLIDTTNWEAHRNYQDIHYVIRGEESIEVAPVSTATVVIPYNPTRDLTFYKATGKRYIANPGNFFIFFPQDCHRPNVRVRGDATVKKIVIKIRRGDL